MKNEDIHYIFNHAEVDLIVVDREYVHLLDGFNPAIRRIVDEDTDATEGELSGEFDDVIRQGLEYDRKNGNKGWDGLVIRAEDEDEICALAYTSGTTSRPKVRATSDYGVNEPDEKIGCRIYPPRYLYCVNVKRYRVRPQYQQCYDDQQRQV